MAARRPTGTRNETIHCEFCGEDYAVTYKRCPFCNGRPVEEREPTTSGGGRHLAQDSRSSGYGGGTSIFRMIGTVLSIALIVAAVCIVVSVIKPMIDRGNIDNIDPDSTPFPVGQLLPGATPGPQVTPLPQITPLPQVTPVPLPGSTADPNVSPAPDVSTPPQPSVPAGQTATSFVLNKTEFTMSDKYPDPYPLKATFSPSGSTGTITWTSSNPDVASVSATGLVTRGTKNGSTVITATMAGGYKQECRVLCNFTTPGGSSSSSSSGSTDTPSGGSSSASLKLNREDFTLSRAGETFRMKVSGTSSTPTWTIGNEGVATIASDGTVTAVSKGSTTITCTVDGQTLTCIVRCNF